MSKTPTPDPIDVFAGAKLRELRIAAGLSQDAIGDVAGISFQQVQKYENAGNRISVSRLMQFATLLKVSPVVFFPSDSPQKTRRIDPLEERAMAIYDRERRRRRGWPAWSDLSKTDVFDRGMKAIAQDLAKTELAAERKPEIVAEPEAEPASEPEVEVAIEPEAEVVEAPTPLLQVEQEFF